MMGTWSSPQTKEAALELQLIMRKPIRADEAVNKLYYLCGDDDLFDLFDECESDEDVRPMVKSYIAKWLNQQDDFFVPWTADAITICQQIIQE